ncbi:MAG: hypothetical protein U9N46_14280, partial [Euryarchaeota archaeon]|nr:hypothetical protein [Euryarchaeota archaeon]
TRRIQRATYLLSIEDGVTKRNKNGKVLGCGTHPNMESFHHPNPIPTVIETELHEHAARIIEDGLQAEFVKRSFRLYTGGAAMKSGYQHLRMAIRYTWICKCKP